MMEAIYLKHLNALLKVSFAMWNEEFVSLLEEVGTRIHGPTFWAWPTRSLPFNQANEISKQTI
jgi:hypothetical protein